MALGIDRKDFEMRQLLREEGSVLSERMFYLLFALALLWGFLVNLLTIVAFQGEAIRLMNGMGGSSVILFFVAYLISCFAGSRLMTSRNPLVSFIGYNLIAIPLGVPLSATVAMYDPHLVYNAFLLTASITLLMIGMAMIRPAWFDGIGRSLGMSLGCCIIVELLGWLFFPRFFHGLDLVVAAIMCLYIGYDWGRMSMCARTADNAIDFAASLYLDIINLFLRLLRILARNKD